HHDDHDGGHFRGIAAGAGYRRRRRNAPAAGGDDRRRPDTQSDPHAVHHARRVPVPGPLPPLAAGPPPRRRGGGSATGYRTPMSRAMSLLSFPGLAHAPRRALLLACCCAWLSACAVGPDYQRPTLDVGESYKEAPAPVDGWKPAQPRDAAERGAWWQVYGDATLDALMQQLNTANQTIAQAEANYRQAQALVQGARSGFFPTVGANTSATRAGGGSGAGGGVANQYNLSGSASWEADLWGRVRREVEASRAEADASFADLANARLSAQSALAQNYFQLRILDEQKRLLESTVAAYEKSLRLTQNRYQAGVAGKSDVSVALAQLENTRAQLIDLEWQRGQFEHAIAVLVGLAPSRFALAPARFAQALP